MLTHKGRGTLIADLRHLLEKTPVVNAWYAARFKEAIAALEANDTVLCEERLEKLRAGQPSDSATHHDNEPAHGKREELARRLHALR